MLASSLGWNGVCRDGNTMTNAGLGRSLRSSRVCNSDCDLTHSTGMVALSSASTYNLPAGLSCVNSNTPAFADPNSSPSRTMGDSFRNEDSCSWRAILP